MDYDGGLLMICLHSTARSAVTVLARSKFCSGPKLAALALLLPLVATAREGFLPRVSVPAAGTYDRSLALSFTVRFAAPVVVQGTPRLTLDVGGATRYATVVSALSASSASSEVTFEYLPAAADNDADGIVVANKIDLNGGAIVASDSTPVGLIVATPDTRAIRIGTLLPPTPKITTALRGGKGDTLVLEGTADGESMVMITRADVGVIGATIAAPNGAWSFECNGIQAGSFQFTAAIENTEGLVSAESAPLRVSITETAGMSSGASGSATSAAL